MNSAPEKRSEHTASADFGPSMVRGELGAPRITGGMFVLVVAVFSTAVQGQDYRFTSENDEITITGYIGDGGAVSIPSTINGLPVTTIGENAFRSSSVLTDVTIPDSVTSIGQGTFQRCTSLTSITIPGRVASIADQAFSGCETLEVVFFEGDAPDLSGASVFSTAVAR